MFSSVLNWLLHFIASHGNVEALTALLDVGAAVDLLDSKKQTALSRAAQMVSLQVHTHTLTLRT